jgi:hypothetical protein
LSKLKLMTKGADGKYFLTDKCFPITPRPWLHFITYFDLDRCRHLLWYCVRKWSDIVSGNPNLE